ASGSDEEVRSDVVDLEGRPHVVGVTWPEGEVSETATVELREEREGEWGAWQEIHVEAEEGPDPGTEEAEQARAGTMPWVSTADALQVRVVGDDESDGEAARLDVVDTTVTAADEAVTADVRGGAAAAASRPTIHSRAAWGADESIRRGSPSTGEVKAAIVHHTAGSNNYSQSQVPGILRGIYSFHVKGNGWNDIGYNYLVDKFGGVWEGRYGGTTRDISGAHAAPFNSSSFGISVLGDFTSYTPPAAVPAALDGVIGWRLGLKGIDPAGTTYLEGEGTSPTVIGHRDVNQTSCPGARLHAMLPSIRTDARAAQGTMLYQPSINRTRYGYGSAGVTVATAASRALTWRLTVTSPCSDGPVAESSGKRSGAGAFTASWNGRRADGSFVPPGRYTVTLTGASGTGTRATALSSSWTLDVVARSDSPPSLCPPRLSGRDRYAVAVSAAVEKDSRTRRVVLVNGASGKMADALVAGPLARSDDAVLLLTRAGSLPAVTRSEIVRRGVTDVTVVGGTASVSSTVVRELRSAGVSRVERVEGESRYEVAANVARRMAGGAPVTDVVAASGQEGRMADGLVLSGPAAALGRPILLLRSGEVPEATAAAVAELGVRRTVVAGGTATVSAEVLADLPRATRLSGTSRYAVSATVASWARGQGVDVSGVLVSSGVDAALADTLSGGQLARPILYVRADAYPRAVRTWLAGAATDEVTVLGGTSSVSMVTGGAVLATVTR
ncbi:cell wall-binding repeat-containing protein, partial [Phycicoccus sp. BSK3Z-2]